MPAYEADAVEIVEAPVFEPPVFESFETPAFDVPIHEVPVTGTPMFEVPVFETRAATPDAHPVQPFGMFSSSHADVDPRPGLGLGARVDVGSAVDVGDAVGRARRPVPPRATRHLGRCLLRGVDGLRRAGHRVAVRGAGRGVAVRRAPETFVPDPAHAGDPRVPRRRRSCPSRPWPRRPSPTSRAADVVVEDVVVESTVEEVVEAAVEELAPILARTASDPAPMMSFDSTSVMPPLSLLPPLPGSRGRGVRRCRRRRPGARCPRSAAPPRRPRPRRRPGRRAGRPPRPSLPRPAGGRLGRSRPGAVVRAARWPP